VAWAIQIGLKKDEARPVKLTRFMHSADPGP
jgi:hypothetical protein